MEEVKNSRDFMRNFFERMYEKEAASFEGALKLPLEEKDKAMWLDPDSKDEWKQWKLIESTVSENDVLSMFSEIGCTPPECLIAYFTVYHHYFDDPVGRHPVSKPFAGLKNAWNPALVKAGFLPFAWDEEHSLILFIDLENMPDQYSCPVCQIDHEILFDITDELYEEDDDDEYDDDTDCDDDELDDECDQAMEQAEADCIRLAVIDNMEELAPDFFTFLNNILEE